VIRMKKLRIYLADLVHNSFIKGPFTMPLNIGYLAAYAKKHFGKNVEITLFKFPTPLLDAIRIKPPHILGLGNYAWNSDLNYKVIEYAKRLAPESIAVLGGPNFPIVPEEQRAYLERRQLIDCYVLGAGESAFRGIIERALGQGVVPEVIRSEPLAGCVFLHGKTRELVVGGKAGGIESLDDIPSPYLSGELDSFFNENLIPLIEADRGCPYTCTFCAWGRAVDKKVKVFDICRVKEELNYIRERVRHTNLLFLANANFGMFDRDLEIAAHIKHLNRKYGYPQKIQAFWAKNTPRRIIDIAEMLGDLTEITMSFQSLSPEVLKNINRTNIEAATFLKMQEYFVSRGIPTITELILGLPGETKETHMQTLRTLFDIGASNITCYNCRILGGTVLDTREERERYGIKTKFRLYDMGFGKYGEICSFESDEVVRSTGTLSEEGVLYFRIFHWLIQFFWSYKYYFPIIKFLYTKGIHPIDFIQCFIEEGMSGHSGISDILNEFEQEARQEFFCSKEELIEYYHDDNNFKKLMSSGFGKMNYKYMFLALSQKKSAFDAHVAYTARKLLAEKGVLGRGNTADNIIKNLISYMQEVCVVFDQEMGFSLEKTAEFDYDVARWGEEHYKRDLADYFVPERIALRFYMPAEQYKALAAYQKQFKHTNKVVTLMKMSEYMKKSDLFYKVERASTLKNDSRKNPLKIINEE